MRNVSCRLAFTIACICRTTLLGQGLEIPINEWVKLSPLPGTPASPRLGYEGACVWDSVHSRVLRYGGHNQGGGGEQHAETWSFDPLTARWEWHQPNVRPPGICCGQQNVFDPVGGRYIRFPAFSHSHGWQWMREVYLNDSSVWTYDLAENRWRNMRPVPTPTPRPLRCASWDQHQQVLVLFGGEGSREGTWTYDPAVNEWTRKRPPEEPAFRSGGNMAYDERARRHILFGSQFDDDPHTWGYDLEADRWVDLEPPTLPPTDKNDAVLTYDSLHQVVIAVIKQTVGEEEEARHTLSTWAYDSERNEWRALKPAREPDPSGNRARQLMFAPELNAVLLENRTKNPEGTPEQQIWAYRYGPAKPGTAEIKPMAKPAHPPLVTDLVVSVLSTNRVRVRWTEPTGKVEPAGYHVERAWVEVLTEDQLTRLKSRTEPLSEPSVGVVRRIGAFKRLTGAPVNGGEYEDEVDLTAPRALNEEPIFEREIHEDHLDSNGKPYRYAVFAYRVRMVDRSGRVGGPSPVVFTIPSAVQHLFAMEDEDACRLKWEPNPEERIQGYRVYRLNGRYDKEAVPRLTSDPVADVGFIDPTAGKSTRRYYVVAVDAIGQEGHPSPPVWFKREWERFYRPFAGEWHQ